jgi:hypothetical protein
VLDLVRCLSTIANDGPATQKAEECRAAHDPNVRAFPPHGPYTEPEAGVGCSEARPSRRWKLLACVCKVGVKVTRQALPAHMYRVSKASH